MPASEFWEIQRFSRWWHYGLAGFPFVLVCCVSLAVYTGMIPQKGPSGPATWFLALPMAGTLLVFLWFVTLKLETNINAEGIHVKFHGIPFCHRHITWQEIKSISVLTYAPFSDYGGWGVRYSLSGKGWCYNVAGDKGIQILYQDGRSFLIGTQQPEQASTIISHYLPL